MADLATINNLKKMPKGIRMQKGWGIRSGGDLVPWACGWKKEQTIKDYSKSFWGKNGGKFTCIRIAILFDQTRRKS